MDFDVAVAAQGGEPVPCSSVVASFTHMAPEMITHKMLTKVTLHPNVLHSHASCLSHTKPQACVLCYMLLKCWIMH